MSQENASPLNAMQAHAHLVMDAVPWAKTLGFEIIRIEKAKAYAKVGWKEGLIGDPKTGVIAGGVITSLLDNLCGVAISAALDEFKSMATLDLRIDYMRPSEPKRDILAEAECYHLTRSVAFTRAWAYHESLDKVIASAAGAFALNDPKRWKTGGTTEAIQKAARLSK